MEKKKVYVIRTNRELAEKRAIPYEQRFVTKRALWEGMARLSSILGVSWEQTEKDTAYLIKDGVVAVLEEEEVEL